MHWLPMQKHIKLKTLMLMRNCLVYYAPSYLRELRISDSSTPGRCFHLSTVQDNLVVPPIRPSSAQSQSFFTFLWLKTVAFDHSFVLPGPECLWLVSLGGALYKFVIITKMHKEFLDGRSRQNHILKSHFLDKTGQDKAQLKSQGLRSSRLKYKITRPCTSE